jgi:hypothetical protein
MARDVRCTTSSGSAVYFSKAGESVNHNNGCSTTVRVTSSSGSPIRVINPNSLPSDLQRMHEQAMR